MLDPEPLRPAGDCCSACPCCPFINLISSQEPHNCRLGVGYQWGHCQSRAGTLRNAQGMKSDLCFARLLPNSSTHATPILWVELSLLPPKDVEALTPSPWDVILFGNRVFADDQVKMGSSGQVIIQYDWCPHKKENLDPYITWGKAT